jgi:DNA polymerase (family 10)
MLAGMARREVQQIGVPTDAIIPVGGLRRFEPAVRAASLLVVATLDRHPEVIAAVAGLPMVNSVIDRSETHMRVATDRGGLEIQLAVPEAAGAALVWHTGSRRHVKWLQARAAIMELRFTADGLRERSAAPLPTADEHAVYRLLGLPFVPPELRDGGGRDRRGGARADADARDDGAHPR